MHQKSLQQLRREYLPTLPDILKDLTKIDLKEEQNVYQIPSKIKELFTLTSQMHVLKAQKATTAHPPQRALKVGVVFSGGQAAGGHNVITGLYDALKSLHRDAELFGFLNGPGGICQGKYKELTEEIISPYRNQGGFDLIGSGRSKIQTQEQLLAALKTVRSMNLDGLVIVGGDDSNTNAAVLAEFFLKNECPVKVIGVPKTIDGDLKNAYVATSFGFDTACKIYAELIGNIARDALSAQKYYHFIRLMGRSASHIALECALATQPNLTLIGEEIAAEKKSLQQVVQDICDLICKRAALGKHFGVILVPEGLIEFIHEIGMLIHELNALLAENALEAVRDKLTASSRKCFSLLPQEIQEQLLLNRDPHGNVQVSFIETEKLLIHMVKKELLSRKDRGSDPIDFNAIAHFFGYEGRCGFPSNFDCNYCYALGHTAALLIEKGITSYMCSVQQLNSPVSAWEVGAVPLSCLMDMQMRKGQEKPVIKKTLVDLKGEPFIRFSRQRRGWEVEDTYLFPGPIQFFGPSFICDSLPISINY